MKDKSKLLKNLTDEELLAEITKRSGSKKGLPTKARCFRCSQDFWIKWNQTIGSHSKVYDWDYWTGEPTKDKICGNCLRSLRSEKSYLKVIRNSRKRQILPAYLVANRI